MSSDPSNSPSEPPSGPPGNGAPDADRPGYDRSPREDEVSLLDILLVLARHKALIVRTVLVFALLGVTRVCRIPKFIDRATTGETLKRNSFEILRASTDSLQQIRSFLWFFQRKLSNASMSDTIEAGIDVILEKERVRSAQRCV